MHLAWMPIAAAAAAAAACAGPTFHEVPVERPVKADSPLTDLLRHFPTDDKKIHWKDYDDVCTTLHENNHFLSAILSNHYTAEAGTRRFAFYVGGGRCVVLPDPGVKKSRVRALVPRVAGLTRDETYVRKLWPSEGRDSETGEVLYQIADAHEDRPLVLLDEWAAYWRDAEQALCEARAGRPVAASSLEALPEFAFFCTGLAMEVARANPDYLGGEFGRFFVWLHRESARAYREGLAYDVIRPGDATRRAVVHDPAGEPLRAFLRQRFRLDLAALYPD
jgi:hypothetical protein